MFFVCLELSLHLFVLACSFLPNHSCSFRKVCYSFHRKVPFYQWNCNCLEIKIIGLSAIYSVPFFLPTFSAEQTSIEMVSRPCDLDVLKSWNSNLKLPSRDRMSTLVFGNWVALKVFSSSSWKSTRERISKPLKNKRQTFDNYTCLVDDLNTHIINHW